MTTPSSSQGQKYQGYPYINPIVIDAPTIDAQTAAQWSNLPRRQLVPPRKLSIPKTEIYIDLPEIPASGNNYTRPPRLPLETTLDEKTPEDEAPVVYIDLPESGSSQIIINDAREDERRGQNFVTNNSRITEGPSLFAPESIKASEDEAPVVYVDLPESGSTQSSRNVAREDEEDFVNETILYDPFKNRRIDMSTNEQNQSRGSTSTQENLGHSFPSSPPNYPTIESLVYGAHRTELSYNTPEERVPPAAYPEPPPAYSEIDTTEEIPPRTEVIVRDTTDSVVGLASSNRKLVTCPHCGLLVNTLALRENGILTHALACFCFFFFVPFCFLVYLLSCLKHRNHYCPNCNKKIGCEIPLLCYETKINNLGPLTLLIYCFEFFKYINHYCPNCNKEIGHEIPIFYLCLDMRFVDKY